MSPAGCSVSVCIPAYRAERTLRRAIEAALDQDLTEPFEVIVCISADDASGHAAYGALPADDRLTILRHTPNLSASDARQRCIDASGGEMLAFTDADALPHRDWLTRLVRASAGGTKIVGGSVVNGTPRSGPGTAEYLVEFVDLAPRRPARTAWHGALCNLLIPRSLWERYGPFPELCGGGEDTVITAAARSNGEFAFCGEAAVTHLNRTGALTVVVHQYDLGRFAAHIARVGPYKFRALLLRPWLAPVNAGGRVLSLYVRAMLWMPGQRLLAVAMFPLVVAMLASWGAGLYVEGRRLDNP